MTVLLYTLIATFLVSAISLIGVFTLAIKHKHLDRFLLVSVALASGALLGGAFLHLLSEAVEKSGTSVFIWTLVSFLIFFIVEKIFAWRHCHKENCEIHTFGYMSLIGDALHNFIDGLVIAAAFSESIHLGVIVSLMVALHEIPQEIGDFGTLLLAGFTKKRALLMNFLTGVTAVIGGIVGICLSNFSSSISNILLPFAAGGFIYIAASDLVPEFKKETRLKESLIVLLFFVLGIGIIYSLKFIPHLPANY